MKNSNDTIGNRTRDLPACSSVLQTTRPPRAPDFYSTYIIYRCGRVLSSRGLCDELITRPEESYRLCCVVVCDLETSRMGAPYI